MPSNRAQVYHNLSVMFDAGLPALRSLRTAAAGARGPLAKGLGAVAEAVSAGEGMAEAMAEHPKVFPSLDVVLMQVGETSGNLAECLKCLSAWHGFCDRLRRIATSAALLPLLIFHAAAFIGPLPALFLGGIGSAQYVLQVVGVLALLYLPAAAILAIVRLTPGAGPLRRFLDGLLLRAPLLGRAVRQLALSRYCQAFHMLYTSGVPIVRASELATEAAGNTAMAAVLGGGTDSARAGNPVSEGFSRDLPKEFLDAWQIGEEAGALDDVTRRLADNAAEAAERMFVTMAVWLPRVFYALVCVLLVMRIFSAYSMVGTIR